MHSRKSEPPDHRKLVHYQTIAGRACPPWSVLEITGNVRRLTPRFFELTFLTGLYLGGNRLSTLPREISKLSNLTFLDLSHNVLEELPKEIGELLRMRELRLEGNRLRNLPHELGKLFQLTVLKLDGNPLSTEILNYALESQVPGTGTLASGKLLTYLLENLQGNRWNAS